MSKHQGRIIKKAIQQSGYSVVKVASMLSISQKTLYNRFKVKTLKPEFLKEVEMVLHHSFASDIHEIGPKAKGFPEGAGKSPERQHIEAKYSQLVKHFELLYPLLLETAERGNFRGYKRAIEHFVDNHPTIKKLLRDE